MKISELKNGMSNVNLRAKVVDISDKREVMTKYGKRSVADATIEDETGQITLTLWGEQINEVSVGDTIEVKGAFVTEFREKLQVSVPRSGKIVKEVENL
ncbi:MAG: OB-fold nucleic acid binding domain-containing protein [Candidatus Aenigmarchaeota archaeon]|nr:OB-fold nucleic acid binding domain-containing protein [Candidatus Aenigmarchaeota archaeon]